MGPGLATVEWCISEFWWSADPYGSDDVSFACVSTCICSGDAWMEGSWIAGPGDFSLAPNASRATWELLRSAWRSCSAGRSADAGAGLVICAGCDRETCRPALAMELRLGSGFEGGLRNERGSGVEIEEDGAEMELDTAMGSVVDCINAAMEAEGFAPTSRGGRTKAMATSEVMVRYGGMGRN